MQRGSSQGNLKASLSPSESCKVSLPEQDLTGGERYIFSALAASVWAAVRCHRPRAPALVMDPKVQVTGAMNCHNTRMQEHSMMQEMLFTFVVRLPPR